MNVAQRDIAKVRKFARKMGIKIRIQTVAKRNFCAIAKFKELSALIYRKKEDSDLFTLTSVLHEVSHLLNYIVNPEHYREFLKLDDDDESFRARKIQFDLEKRDISKMKEIHALLGLKTNQRAIIASELFDIHQYEHKLKYGSFPTKKERKIIKRDTDILARNYL